MHVVIVKHPDDAADYSAKIFVRQILRDPRSVLGLATGTSPVSLYQELIAAYKAGEISFRDVTTFNLDEYLGLPCMHPQSYQYFMAETLFNHIDINKERTFIPSSNLENTRASCIEYENNITQRGGIDLQLLGIGRNGHIGFNEPSSGLSSRTRVKTLTAETIQDNARFFSTDESQPELAITMGIGTILESKQIVLLATGQAKAQAVVSAIEGPLSVFCPASALQTHVNTVCVLDEAAASLLQHLAFYERIDTDSGNLMFE